MRSSKAGLWSLVLGTALLPWPLRVRAAGQIATNPFQFLFIDGNARATGMGGAYTALAFDSNALLYNPAGLGLADRYEGTYMHHDAAHNLTQEYFGACVKQGFGLNGIYRTFGAIPKTTLDDPSGAHLGHFTIMDLALGLGYGKEILPNLGFGVGYKYVREVIDDVGANSHAVDLGLLFLPRPRFSLAFAAQNLGPTFRYHGASENLPLNLRWGAAYGFDLLGAPFTAAIDGIKQPGDRTNMSAGMETVVGGHLALRIGYSSRNDSGPGLTGGAGVRYKDFSFDYAVAPNGSLGWSHRYGMTFRWRGAGPKDGSGEDWPDYKPAAVKLKPAPDANAVPKGVRRGARPGIEFAAPAKVEPPAPPEDRPARPKRAPRRR
ncbi:MAG: PorV/PorQ family protein [Elusimicrobia bacterium]|nr:PorV/PorQ family protein [Elusimicrobiota bacterium]